VRVILASGSAIRRKLMTDAGLDFDVILKPVDEAENLYALAALNRA